MSEPLLYPENLAPLFEPILKHCPLFAGKNLSVLIIANPKAGGFTRPKVSRANYRVLREVSERADEALADGGETPLAKSVDITLKTTSCAGEGSVFARELVDALVAGGAGQSTSAAAQDLNPPKDSDQPQAPNQPQDSAHWLIITAGGDGTHLEVQTALLKASLESAEKKDAVTNRITILRLPFGTGNDGSDGRELSDTLLLLTSPSHFALQRAVKVWYEGDSPMTETTKRHTDKYDSLDVRPPWYSFNIASIGIDAFITYMTNKTKKIAPGDTYQLWVDLACLFYAFQFPRKQMVIELFDEGGQLLRTIETGTEFCLLGVSGHRTYGSNHRILPGNETFCLARKMSTVSKLLIKSKANTGAHAKDTKRFVLATANKIKISYNEHILVQMDGEVHHLEADCYPLYMERTEPTIRVIERDDTPFDKGAVRI